jgi:sensor domain CHASE-containing protein
MIGFLRPILLFFVLLVAIHIVLRLWLRLRERRRLRQEWEESDQLVERDIYLETGMAEYDRSLRKRLLWLTIVGPMAGLVLLLYLVNQT